MFIKKWRYEQNLENARRDGIREGKREANEQKFAYIEYLEEENRALKEKLKAVSAADISACHCDENAACCETPKSIAENEEQASEPGVCAVNCTGENPFVDEELF